MLERAELQAFLLELCAAAEAETLPRFRNANTVTNKLAGGFDPVTQADREAERVIRKHITERFPDHAIIGEEYGSQNVSESGYQWIIDPIDGTRAFISGLPLWGTLIACYRNNKPLAGVMAQPFTGEIYLSDSQESWLLHAGQKHRLKTSAISELQSATLMTTSPMLFQPEKREPYDRVEAACQLARYGADCYAYCMLASGSVDLVIESGLNVYDIAALIPLIRDAGGLVTDWQGNPDPWGGDVIAAANPQIHAAALALLNA